MIQSINKKYLTGLFSVYLILLLYFMFFGFGRLELAEIHEYRYALLPVSIPLWVPNRFSLGTLQLWIFTLGNLLVFVPFGILAPLVFKRFFQTYSAFIILFLLFIVSLEILQMVTYLGSFDSEDIIVNTMGALIGFCSYRASARANTRGKKFVWIGITIAGLTLLAFLAAEVFNSTITPHLKTLFGVDY